MDYEAYIEQSLLNIQDLNERKIMRQVFMDVLIPLYKFSEENYKKLEDDLYKEEECTGDSYSIVTGIIDRKKYDITLDSIKLMKQEDSEEKIIDFYHVKEALEQGTKCKLFPIYIRSDYRTIRELEVSNRKYNGVICTDEGEYKAEFELKRNTDYIEQLMELYKVFINNSIPWSTVCAPYLYKIFDVYMVGADNVQGEFINEITIQFEEFEEYIKYDYVPIWNIDTVNLKSSVVPTPCNDQLHYQHIIFKERLDSASYLVLNSDVYLVNQQRKDGDLIITCSEENPVNWQLLKICNNPEIICDELLFSNKMMNSSYIKRVRTKADLKKFINELGYSKYLKLRDISINNDYIGSCETYSMDGYIAEEIKLSNNKNILLFEFENLMVDLYLSQDILSYIVTRLQWEYPEFQCIGKFV